MSWQEMDKEMNNVQQDKHKVDFVPLKQAKPKKGLKILSYGNFSAGKTHFSLTADDPLWVVDTERGVTPLAKNFPDKNINIITIFEPDVGKFDKDDVVSFEKIDQAIEYLNNLPEEQVKTVVVDSISDYWDFSQAYAKTKISNVAVEKRTFQDTDWTVPNKLYTRLIVKLMNMNCNVILCSRATEDYAVAGSHKPATQKKTAFFVDIILFHDVKIIKGEQIFTTIIEKCRMKGELIGKKYENLNFNKLKEEL